MRESDVVKLIYKNNFSPFKENRVSNFWSHLSEKVFLVG